MDFKWFNQAGTSGNFMRLDKIFSLDHIEGSTINHLKKVYLTLATTSIFAFIGSVLSLQGYIQVSFLTIFGTIGCLWYILLTNDSPIDQSKQKKRLFALFTVGLLSGVNVSPLVQVAIDVDPSIVPSVLLGTVAIFVSFTMAALRSKDRRYLLLEGSIFSGMSLLFVWNIISMFSQSQMLENIRLLLMLVLMTMFVLYDTQLMIAKREYGDTDYVKHSFDLFCDFMQMFRLLLALTTQKESKKKRNRQREE